MAANRPDRPALTAAQHSKIRRLSAPKEAEPGEEGGELNVVPYLDIIMNVMMFMLAAVSIVFVSSVTSQAANASPGIVPHDGQPLRLTALVTADGVGLTTSGGHIAPGCDGIGPGLTIPRRDGAHDLTALTACARRIKGSRPDLATETQVTVSASPNVDYQEIIAVMDAFRADEAGSLFPAVTLGVAR